jgi:2-hydroxychromene-2-carboxylate isomerase
MKMMSQEAKDARKEVKMYSDFKSPYAYLAFDPGMSLGERFNVSVRWIPFQLRLTKANAVSIPNTRSNTPTWMRVARPSRAAFGFVAP